MKKTLGILLPAVLFIVFLFLWNPNCEETIVREVISPAEIILDTGVFRIKGVSTFDADYTEHNKVLSQKLNLSEDEAFIFGNFGKYWAEKMLLNRNVRRIDTDITYNKLSYNKKFENSPYCLKDDISNNAAYLKLLNSIRKGKFVLVDVDTDEVYPISKENRAKLKNYIVLKKSHARHLFSEKNDNIFYDSLNYKTPKTKNYNSILNLGNIKIIVSDSTTKLFPDRKCSSEICKEILNNINLSQNTIDIAIYGYSTTPEINKAINDAINRGVKVRLVYDVDSQNKNIYPNTAEFVKLISDNVNDGLSLEKSATMHNKFYIFDGQKVITGSANLSHTDMSGFNSNSIIVINSKVVAKMYEQEFNQMFEGKFHNEKISHRNVTSDKMQIYFSPQDRAITNGVLPVIYNAKKYIYIPTFMITDKRVTDALIKAYKSGVDVKIIVDALNASNSYSKHTTLRLAGIPVKTENYAGKMHSKTIIADDKYLIIGSMNFSKSGETKNDENMIVLENVQAAQFYRRFFLYQWERIPDKWLKYNARAEGLDSIGSCTDGIDNNYDGKTDNEDDACNGAKLQK